MIMPPSGGPGAQPRHAFGSFRRETKGTPGVGRVGPPMGRSEEPSLTTCSWRGAAPPRIGGRRGSQPRTTSRGAGRSACIGGCRDSRPRINPAGRSPKKRIVSPPTKAGTYREDHLRLSTTEERIETPIKITTSPTLCGVSTSHKLPVRLCATMSASSTCTIISGESPSIEPSR